MPGDYSVNQPGSMRDGRSFLSGAKSVCTYTPVGNNPRSAATAHHGSKQTRRPASMPARSKPRLKLTFRSTFNCWSKCACFSCHVATSHCVGSSWIAVRRQRIRSSNCPPKLELEDSKLAQLGDGQSVHRSRWRILRAPSPGMCASKSGGTTMDGCKPGIARCPPSSFHPRTSCVARPMGASPWGCSSRGEVCASSSCRCPRRTQCQMGVERTSAVAARFATTPPSRCREHLAPSALDACRARSGVDGNAPAQEPPSGSNSYFTPSCGALARKPQRCTESPSVCLGKTPTPTAPPKEPYHGMRRKSGLATSMWPDRRQTRNILYTHTHMHTASL